MSGLLDGEPELARACLAVGATRHGDEEYFLDEINHHVYAGDTALHIAAAAYEPGLTRALVNAGAIVRAANRRGAEPLHYAVDGIPGSARWNPVAQRETVFCLIELGADPNAVDKNGTTPLHRAVRNRCAAAVKVLLDVGVDPHSTNGSGSTAMQLARWTTGRGAGRLTRGHSNRRSSDSCKLLPAHDLALRHLAHAGATRWRSRARPREPPTGGRDRPRCAPHVFRLALALTAGPREPSGARPITVIVTPSPRPRTGTEPPRVLADTVRSRWRPSVATILIRIRVAFAGGAKLYVNAPRPACTRRFAARPGLGGGGATPAQCEKS
jgi:hypothetical protein